MTARWTALLGFLTLIATLGAIWALFGERHGDSDLRGQQLLPDLATQIDRIAQVVIADDTFAVTIDREGDDWRIAEKANHLADRDRLRTLILALSTMRIERVTTEDPALYERIGLGASARSVRLNDTEGKEILALSVGKRQYANRAFATFVRVLPEARSYLVTGLPEIRAEPSSWLPAMLFSLERRRLASLRIRRDGDGTAAFEIRRDSAREAFRLADMAPDEAEAGFMTIDQLATSATAITASDARPAEEITGLVRLGTLAILSFDGLAVEFAFSGTGDGSGDAWAILAVTADPKDDADDKAAILAEAEALRKRVEGFAYRIPTAKVASLLKDRSDLVKKREDTPSGDDKP
ncbi:MAG: hypothetical protein Kow00104_08760 [Rhodothalassiaceae bacterium]